MVWHGNGMVMVWYGMAMVWHGNGMVIYVSDASLSGPAQYASACPTTSDTAICLRPICVPAFYLSLLHFGLDRII